MTFEWDEDKAEANRRKHRVTFEEAQSVFHDPVGLVEYDLTHSQAEDRWRAIGMSIRLRVITTYYTRRDEAIRIISARRATKAEEGRYAASR